MKTQNRLNDNTQLSSIDDAIANVPAHATLAVSGFGSVGYPKRVPKALAESDQEFDLTVLSGGSVGDEIDTALVESGNIKRRYPYQARSASRKAINERKIHFQDRHIARLGEDILLGHLPSPDVAIVEAVAIGSGWLVPSTSIGQTRAFVEAADKLIVELNHAQPLSLQNFHDIVRVGPPPRTEGLPLKHPGQRIGEPTIEFGSNQLVAVVETDIEDQPYEFRTPTEVDTAVATNLARFLQTEIARNPALSESLCLQFGVGSLGNALMGAFKDIDFRDRDIIYYGEVIQDGLLDMLDAGKLEVASATSLALSEEGMDRLFENPEKYAEDIVLRPASVSNRAALIDRFGVVAVNSALEIDLYGHVNSTHLDGTQILNGIGGSGDFTRNGLIGIMALPSTAADNTISRIVPRVPHVDHTEHDVGVVVTEHGVADIRSLSPMETAKELISECSHPAFEDQLRSYLEGAKSGSGHEPHDPALVRSWPADEL